jgi:hypothetical protein
MRGVMEETVQRYGSYSAESRNLKEPDEFDLWERDQSIISQIGDELDFFIIDGNPVLHSKRETSLS